MKSENNSRSSKKKNLRRKLLPLLLVIAILAFSGLTSGTITEVVQDSGIA